MSGNRRHDQHENFEEPEATGSGREPWGYRTEYVGGGYYPQSQPLVAQAERRSAGQDIAVYPPNVPRTFSTPHSAYPAPQSGERNEYRDIVESTQKLNLNAQGPRDAGERNRGSNRAPQHRSYSFNPEVPQQSGHYHLSSTLENPPLTAVTPRYRSDVVGYDRHISNFQVGYHPGYSNQSENDYNSPTARTNLSYPNSNPLGGNTIAAAFTNPQSNVNQPTWSGPQDNPMSYGAAFRPLSQAVDSRWVSFEDRELDLAHKIEATDVSETLDESYRVRDHPRRYFRVGQVFALLWSQPAGKTGTTLTKYNEHVYSKIRRMVVVAEKKDCCWCLAIHTYGGRGIDKPSLDLKTHAVIRTPDVLNCRKTKAMIQDEFIVAPEEGETLRATSILNFEKVYTVEHNVKAKSIGKLTPKGAVLLSNHWARQFVPRHHRKSSHGHH